MRPYEGRVERAANLKAVPWGFRSWSPALVKHPVSCSPAGPLFGFAPAHGPFNVLQTHHSCSHLRASAGCALCLNTPSSGCTLTSSVSAPTWPAQKGLL